MRFQPLQDFFSMRSHPASWSEFVDSGASQKVFWCVNISVSW
jgi:hypothetical protein